MAGLAAPPVAEPSPAFEEARDPSPPRPVRKPSPEAPLFDDDAAIEWSPSPPPAIRERSPGSDEAGSDVDEDELHAHQDGDEAAEMVEEDNYASFLAGVKGKDLNTVQEELDAEVERLRQDKRKMTRDGDENITAQMVGQIQLLLQRYGIPYITAPSEAEAQCAALASLNLVDGIITDDSDVFLFGGKQCFKNLFNDHKYVECYVLSDFDRELCLNQERLVTLAFLLGSDYTAGVPGVGYVTAMEIMAEFPGVGDEGLVRFRNWWIKVQTGKDTEEDTCTKWRQSFVSLVNSFNLLLTSTDNLSDLPLCRRRNSRTPSISPWTSPTRKSCVVPPLNLTPRRALTRSSPYFVLFCSDLPI